MRTRGGFSVALLQTGASKVMRYGKPQSGDWAKPDCISTVISYPSLQIRIATSRCTPLRDLAEIRRLKWWISLSRNWLRAIQNRHPQRQRLCGLSAAIWFFGG